MLEDVAVVHVGAAVGREPDGDLDDLVRVYADRVLEAALVVVDRVVELVVAVAFECDDEAPNERWMSGSATFTIVRSSSSMKTPVLTAVRVVARARIPDFRWACPGSPRCGRMTPSELRRSDLPGFEDAALSSAPLSARLRVLTTTLDLLSPHGA
jgi:hypothetical protein